MNTAAGEPVSVDHLRHGLLTVLDTLPVDASTDIALSALVAQVVSMLEGCGIPVDYTTTDPAPDLGNDVPGADQQQAALTYTEGELATIARRLTPITFHPTVGVRARAGLLWVQQALNALAGPAWQPDPPRSGSTTSHDTTGDTETGETAEMGDLAGDDLRRRSTELRGRGIIPTLGVAEYRNHATLRGPEWYGRKDHDCPSILIVHAALTVGIAVRHLHPQDAPCLTDHAISPPPRSPHGFPLGPWAHRARVRSTCGMLHTLADDEDVHGIVVVPPYHLGLSPHRDLAEYIPLAKDAGGVHSEAALRRQYRTLQRSDDFTLPDLLDNLATRSSALHQILDATLIAAHLTVTEK